MPGFQTREENAADLVREEEEREARARMPKKRWTYYVDVDPDDDAFYSVFADNGQGFAFEVAGKIGSLENALTICHRLDGLDPTGV
jgi:nitrogen fixation/metabolism regulation signal transduction histidine kinase